MKWYESWFDSPYYHILYKNRDDKEARNFIDNLIHKIPLNTPASLLDLACGKGRHSIYFHSKGFAVMGVDLSEENIRYAQRFSEKGLQFKVGDMRSFQLDKSFEYIVNLFTSFGYFNSPVEDQRVFNNVYQHLNSGGLFIQDYLNIHFVSQHLVEEETKYEEGIAFHIQRKIEEGFVLKNIQFEDKGEKYNYTERVKIYTLEDFETLAQQSGFRIIEKYGDYSLNVFNKVTSPRLILIYSKP